MKTILSVLLVCVFAACGVDAAEKPWVITEGGKPRALIMIRKNPEPMIAIAAHEIQNYVERISGAKLPIMETIGPEAPKFPKDTTVIFISPIGPHVPDINESFIILTERKHAAGKFEVPPMIRLVGCGELGALHATYAFIEKLGVRFFHPEQEYIPSNPDLQVGEMNVVESPVYMSRGIQQHTLHPIEYTTILMAEPTEENLQHAYRYVEWLAKNRQNYLFWWWVDLYDVAARREYVGKIIKHAHDRGIKVGLVVGMPFHQQHSYNLLKRDACHSDTEKWTAGLHEGIDEIASLGIDAMCVFFGETEGRSFKQPDGCPPVESPVKGTVERIEALYAYVKKEYPHIFVTLWVHPTASTAGDESCPRYFFLPKLCSTGLGAAVHTTMFYDLVNPAPTYGNKDFSALREFAFDQAKIRPTWYWPETAYWCGFDIDLPVYFPLYIRSRWIDAKLLAGKADGHITFSSGLEWMYWLNDYAVARFGWNPKTYTEDRVLDDFASIFASAGADRAVKSALSDLIAANDLYLLKRSKQAGYNLMSLITAGGSKLALDGLEGKPAQEIEAFRADYLPDLEAFAEKYARACDRLKAVESKVGPREKPWFDELVDAIEISRLRFLHQQKAFDAVSRLALDETRSSELPVVDGKVILELSALQAKAKQIIARRASGYRFPAGSSYLGYLRGIALWEQTTDYLKTLANPDAFFASEGVIRPVRAVPAKVSILGEVGTTSKAVITLPSDYPVDRGLRLLMTLSDTDSATEGVMILGGKEYPLPMSGNGGKLPARFDIPAGTFKPGANEIVFRFADNLGGQTRGFYVLSIILAVPKQGP